MASSWGGVLMVVMVVVQWAGSGYVQVQAHALHHKHGGLLRRARGPWNILRGNNNNAGLSFVGLEYYVQVGIGGPDLHVLIEPINTTATNNFGSTELFAFNVTESADPTSTQLGMVYGYTVQASYTTTAHGVEVEILVYDDGYVNGTVSLQGHIINGPNEISIVGGTGDFRGAFGYGLVTFVNSTDSIFLYHHELHFF